MPDAQPRWMLAPPGAASASSWSIVELGTQRLVAIVANEPEARLFLAARELRGALSRIVSELDDESRHLSNGSVHLSTGAQTAALYALDKLDGGNRSDISEGRS